MRDVPVSFLRTEPEKSPASDPWRLLGVPSNPASLGRLVGMLGLDFLSCGDYRVLLAHGLYRSARWRGSTSPSRANALELLEEL